MIQVKHVHRPSFPSSPVLLLSSNVLPIQSYLTSYTISASIQSQLKHALTTAPQNPPSRHRPPTTHFVLHTTHNPPHHLGKTLSFFPCLTSISNKPTSVLPIPNQAQTLITTTSLALRNQNIIFSSLTYDPYLFHPREASAHASPKIK